MLRGSTRHPEGTAGKAFPPPTDEKAPPPLETESGQGWLEFKRGTREAATRRGAVTRSGSAALTAPALLEASLDQGTHRGHQGNLIKDLNTHSTWVPQRESLRPSGVENSLGTAFYLVRRFWVKTVALTPTLPGPLSTPSLPCKQQESLRTSAGGAGRGRVWKQENCPLPPRQQGAAPATPNKRTKQNVEGKRKQ